MKKIMFLGDAPSQVPPIKYALQEGYYVIVCDYSADNPGRKLANEFHNISTTDKEAVFNLAIELKIDGIVAYASDPAAPTAAYVSEKLGLPGNPYKSVETLARKDLFRSFLKENGFNVPKSQSFNLFEGASKWLKQISFPVFVKPVDSSGSKGVTEVNNVADFKSAFDHAMSFSREQLVVVEEKIVKQGYQVAGDGFVVDGELVFRCFADEHFDKLCNGLVPIGQTFPSSHSKGLLELAHIETQKLLSLLNMKTGALNFDFVFTENGEFYFLELGPRNGGCLIPEVICYATGIDLIKATVDAALGINCSWIKQISVEGFWSSYMVHAIESGQFTGLYKSERAINRIVEGSFEVRKNSYVNKYSGSNDTLGMMILKYENLKEMLSMIDNMENDIRVEIIKLA